MPRPTPIRPVIGFGEIEEEEEEEEDPVAHRESLSGSEKQKSTVLFNSVVDNLRIKSHILF
ncbi:MAG: hypothetical protein QF600_08245 [Verrucomicrobiota bacterium]|jgi:hypothetical protein|nr:hypothetical protein [Verrucomicrobiota bacterium]